MNYILGFINMSQTRMEKFALNAIFKIKNKNDAIVNFYKDGSNHINDDVPTKVGIRLASMNCHGFYPINSAHNTSECIEAVFNFMENNNVDILCLQEYRTRYAREMRRMIDLRSNSTIQLSSSVVTLPGNGYMNLIISRHQGTFRTEMLPGPDNRTMVVYDVQIGDKEYCIINTHLTILPRDYSNPDTDEYQIAQKQTEAIHYQQLETIFDERPDFIVGDFNFNTSEPEYNWMKSRGWNTNPSTVPTTPFGTTVDFIWSHTPGETNVGYNIYTDHRPHL